MAKIDCQVNPINTEQYPTTAKRPRNTLMNKRKIKHRFFLEIKNWKKSICIAIKKINKENTI